MLKIRLYPVGKKKQHYYRIIVIPKTNSVKGRYIEQIGFYNPLHKESEIKFDEERLKYWLSVGAKPSDTVQNLMFKANLSKIQIKKSVIKKKKKKKEKKIAKPEVIEAPGQKKPEGEGSLMEEGVEAAIKEEKEKVETAEKIQEAQDKQKPESKDTKSEPAEKK